MRLQKSPIGFLGAFDLQIEGITPTEMAEQLVPVVDVFDLYMRPVTGSRGITVGPTNVQNSGDAISTTVPAGEMWRVWSVSAGVILPAATANADGVGIGLLINAGYVKTDYLRPPTPTVAEFRASSGLLCPRPYLLPSGDSISMNLQTSLGAAVPGFLVIVRDRFPAS